MGRRGAGEGSIARRSDGRWEGRVDLGWHQGRRVRKSVYGKTRREVRDEMARLVREQRQGTLDWQRSPLVSEYLTHWVQSVATRIRPKTAVTYESLVRRHVIPSLGRLPLDKLTPLHVERMVDDVLGSGLSPTTALRSLQVLRIALNHAVRTGLVGRNVAQLVPNPRVQYKEPTFLSPDQSRAFIQAIKGDRMEALITLCLTTGLRQGEALGLRWQDIDLELGTIRVVNALQRVSKRGLVLVEPKTRRSRRALTLPAHVVRSLRGHRDQQLRDRDLAGGLWSDSGFVFTTTLGTPFDGKNVTRDFHVLLKRARLPTMRFHDLRHSAATLLLAEGVPARVVMDVLGHSQISVTLNTYSHVIPPLMKEAAHAMDRIFGESRSDGHTASDER